MVSRLFKPGEDVMKTLTPDKIELAHAVFGISGEGGEVLDQIKKHIFYNKPLDMDNVVEELGDTEFYLEALRSKLDITREQTLEANMQKLVKADNARYKNGYSDDAAIARADKN